MTPFGIYMVTEHVLHASGVIAVVAAGIIHSIVREHTETHMAEEQLLTENTWSIVLFVLNGFVFILLGMDIPSAMLDTISNPDLGNWLAFGYVAVIGFTVLAIRFVWSFGNKALNYYFGKRRGEEKPDIKEALITTLAGVRGAVTMAGVLTVPAVLGNGETFPARSLLIFIAAGVILLLLILAMVFLPLLCKKEAPAGGTGEHTDLTGAKNKLLMSAIKKIKAETNAENEFAALQLINEYTHSFQRNLSEQKSNEQHAEHYSRKTNEAQLLALNLQRKYIKNLWDNDEIDIMVFDTLTRFLDYREGTLDNNLHFGIFFLKRAMRDIGRLGGKHHRHNVAGLDNLHIVRDIQMRAMAEAVKGLEEYAKTQEQPEYVYTVLLDYEKMLQAFKRTGDRYNDKLERQKEELRFKVLDAERSEIRRMYETGEINPVQEKELRRFANHIESIILYEHNE